MALGVVEDPTVDGRGVGDGEHLVGRDDPVLQGGRERHQFEDRARFVDLGEGQVLRRLDDGGDRRRWWWRWSSSWSSADVPPVSGPCGAAGATTLGVGGCTVFDTRFAMDRISSGAGVHDDGDAALGVRRQDLGAEGLLGHVLQGLVDGELDAGAGDGGRAPTSSCPEAATPSGDTCSAADRSGPPAASCSWYSRPD